MKNLKTLIGIQDEYIGKVNSGIERWSHRRDGGHAGRIRRGARRQAVRALSNLGFKPAQIDGIIKDASDVAELERNASTEEPG